LRHRGRKANAAALILPSITSNIFLFPIEGETMPDGFKPGENVLATGIYTAMHYRHRLPHEVFAVQGDQFPACKRCGNRIRFKLMQTAMHVTADRDFSKTVSGPRAKKARAGHKRA
jgi:hypothetical protein